MTVRRDVEALATRGLLRRAHGSVAWPDAAGTLPAVERAERAEEAPARTGAGSGRVLGMVVPQASYYYADVIKGAQAAAAAAGARLVLGITGYRPDQDPVQVARLLEGGAYGLLLTPSWQSGVAQGLDELAVVALGVPTVLVERRAEPGTAAAELDRVCSDHTHGAFLAIRRLASLGHRQIAVVTRRHSPTAQYIRVGCEAARRSLGLPEPLVAPFELDPAEVDPEGFEQVRARLREAMREGVRAVVVHNDLDAVMLAAALQSDGVRIPEDLSVIAYDDEMAALADTPLTAVAPPKRAVGEEAVRILLHRLAEQGGQASPRRHLELLPELRVRASCGQPAIA